MNTTSGDKRQYLVCAFLAVAALVAAHLPLASRMQVHHADERYYTDAALVMRESGDYWTPRFYDGTTRPHKPVFTYWAIAGSYGMFGISYLTARLPAVFAGVLLLLLTYALSLATSRRHDTAFLAVCILETHAAFLMCSNRATPDIFLTASLALGFLGLAMQLGRPEGRTLPLVIVLAGAGMAVMSKGLLGLVFLLVTAFFLRDMLRGSRLWRNVSLLLWFAAISAWFIFMIRRHDANFMSEFLYDQIFGRLIKGNPMYKPLRIAGYLLLIPAMFAPWLLCFLKPGPRRARLLSALRPPRDPCVTAMLAWSAVCALIFGMGNKLTPRYVLSTAPLLAVFLAQVFLPPPDDATRPPGSGGASARRRPSPGFAPAYAALAAMAVLSFPMTGGFAVTQILPAVCFAVIMAIALFFAMRAPLRVAIPAAWSMLVLALPALAMLLLHKPLNDGPERGIVAVVERLQQNPDTRGTVLCHLHPSVLSRARITAGRSLPVKPAREIGTNAVPGHVSARLVSELDSWKREVPEFHQIASVRLPVASSSQVDDGMRANGVPLSQRLWRFLRHGYPIVEYRIEARRQVEAD